VPRPKASEKTRKRERKKKKKKERKKSSIHLPYAALSLIYRNIHSLPIILFIDTITYHLTIHPSLPFSSLSISILFICIGNADVLYFAAYLLWLLFFTTLCILMVMRGLFFFFGLSFMFLFHSILQYIYLLQGSLKRNPNESTPWPLGISFCTYSIMLITCTSR